MSQNISLLPLPVLATAAITNQRFVTAGGAIATAAGRALGVSRSDAASGERFTATAPIAALTATQTGGKAPDGNAGANDLSEAERAICTATGIAPDAFRAARAA